MVVKMMKTGSEYNKVGVPAAPSSSGDTIAYYPFHRRIPTAKCFAVARTIFLVTVLSYSESAVASCTINDSVIGGTLTANPSDNCIINTVNGLTGQGGGVDGLDVSNSTSLTAITNDGSIVSAYGGAALRIYSDSSVTTITNNNTIQSSDFTTTIDNLGNIGSLLNNATILSGRYASAVSNNGTIGSIINVAAATITGQNSQAIYNNGAIGNIYNAGLMTSYYSPILNDGSGTIGTITNEGVIWNSRPQPDVTNYGTITTFNNGQNSYNNVAAPVRYYGNLPTNYNIIINSSSSYGSIYVYPTLTTTKFGISSLSSHITQTTYTDVISNVTVSNFSNSLNGQNDPSGSFEYINGKFVSWSLVPELGNPTAWDLIFANLPFYGPDAVNTLLEMGSTRDDILKALRNRAAVMNTALNYDCMTFDKNGVCIGFNARYSSMDNQNHGAGVMTAAMRLSPTTHLGVFIDYAGKQDAKGAVTYGDENPMFGGFLGYTEKPDRTGLQAHLSAAYHTGDVTVTRPDTLENTEAGSGNTRLTNWAIGAELGYGIAMSKQSNLTPYIGLRYGSAEMAGYTEGSSEAVQYPITFNAFSQRLTTGTAGLRLNGMLNDKVSYQLGGGIEYDLKSDANEFSGSSTIPDLTSFSIPNTANANRLRGNGSVAIGYAIAPNQKLTASVSVRGEAYTDKADTNVMAGYEVGL